MSFNLIVILVLIYSYLSLAHNFKTLAKEAAAMAKEMKDEFAQVIKKVSKP